MEKQVNDYMAERIEALEQDNEQLRKTIDEKDKLIGQLKHRVQELEGEVEQTEKEHKGEMQRAGEYLNEAMYLRGALRAAQRFIAALEKI